MLKKITPIALAITLTFNSTALAFASNSKTNVDYLNHWARSSIENLLANKIISGYDDGSVKPNDIITKAEFVTIVNKVFKLTQKDTTNFKDVPKASWYADQFSIAKKAGYLTGDDKGNVNPLANLKRAELCIIISKVAGLKLVEGNTTFADDAQIPAWAKPYINTMYKEKLISGYADNTFKSNKTVIRAEAFKVIDNFLKDAEKKQEESKEEPSSQDEKPKKEPETTENKTESKPSKPSVSTGGGNSSGGSSSGGNSSGGNSSGGSSSGGSSSGGSSSGGGSGNTGGGEAKPPVTPPKPDPNPGGNGESGGTNPPINPDGNGEVKPPVNPDGNGGEGSGNTGGGEAKPPVTPPKPDPNPDGNGESGGTNPPTNPDENGEVKPPVTPPTNPDGNVDGSTGGENNNGGLDDNTGSDIIPDNTLRANVIKTLGITSAELTEEKLGELTSLKIDGKDLNESSKISSLKGLEHCNKLQTLELPSNKIADLSHLREITSLEKLVLSNNEITDTKALEKLTALTQLDLSHNKVEDITELEKLLGLTHLDLSYNELEDEDDYPLVPLKKLQNLSMRYNYFTYFYALEQSESEYIQENLEQIIKPQRILITVKVKDAQGRPQLLTPVTVDIINKNSGEVVLTDKTDLNGDAMITGVSDQLSPYEHYDIRYSDPTNQYATKTMALVDGSFITELAGKLEATHNMEDNSVNVPDETLRKLIKTKLGLADSHKLTKTDLENLTELEIAPPSEQNKYDEIENLAGLECAINLTRLVLPNQYIASMAPLANLTKLTEIDLRDNVLETDAGIEKLVNLTSLNLNGNYITEFTALNELKKINTIIANKYNQIANPEIQKNMLHISVIDKDSGIGIEDITISIVGPETLSVSTRGDGIFVKDNLQKGSYSITLIDPQGIYELSSTPKTVNLKGITYLTFEVYKKTELVNIPDQALRKHLNENLGRGFTLDLISKTELATLITLDLVGKATDSGVEIPIIDNLEGLQNCINLENLSVNNKVTNEGVKIIGQLTNLKTLWLHDNRNITDISPLANLTKLQELNISQNHANSTSGNIVNISALNNLPLVSLNLSGNGVSTDALSKLPDTIETLVLVNCGLNNIDFINRFTSLKTLNIGGTGYRENNITTVAPLLNSDTLQSLYVNKNKITDKTELERLKEKGIEIVQIGS